jgi:hypothetical protein
MGLFQSKPSMKPIYPIILEAKILNHFPKTASKKETLAEKDDRLKHAAIIFDSKKVVHHIEEQLR